METTSYALTGFITSLEAAMKRARTYAGHGLEPEAATWLQDFRDFYMSGACSQQNQVLHAAVTLLYLTNRVAPALLESLRGHFVVRHLSPAYWKEAKAAMQTAKAEFDLDLAVTFIQDYGEKDLVWASTNDMRKSKNEKAGIFLEGLFTQGDLLVEAFYCGRQAPTATKKLGSMAATYAMDFFTESEARATAVAIATCTQRKLPAWA